MSENTEQLANQKKSSVRPKKSPKDIQLSAEARTKLTELALIMVYPRRNGWIASLLMNMKNEINFKYISSMRTTYIKVQTMNKLENHFLFLPKGLRMFLSHLNKLINFSPTIGLMGKTGLENPV